MFEKLLPTLLKVVLFSLQIVEDLLQAGRTLTVISLDTHEVLSMYVYTSIWIPSFFLGPWIRRSLLTWVDGKYYPCLNLLLYLLLCSNWLKARQGLSYPACNTMGPLRLCWKVEFEANFQSRNYLNCVWSIQSHVCFCLDFHGGGVWHLWLFSQSYFKLLLQSPKTMQAKWHQISPWKNMYCSKNHCYQWRKYTAAESSSF